MYSCPNITDDKFKTFNILDMDLETEEKLYKKDFEGFKNFENLDLKNQTRCRDCSVNAFVILAQRKIGYYMKMKWRFYIRFINSISKLCRNVNRSMYKYCKCK